MSGDEPEDRDDEEVDRDEDDSFYDKNSIAEFEMLEKECFQEEGVPNQSARLAPQNHNAGRLPPSGNNAAKKVGMLDLGQVKRINGEKDAAAATLKANGAGGKLGKKSDKIQIRHESPLKQSARDIINNLKSTSTDKQSYNNHSDESKLDKLESQLMNLIAEQEAEVARLKEENQRVTILQVECQKQLERLNKESLEQERAKK